MVLSYLKKGLELGLHAANIDKKRSKIIVSDLVKAGKLTAKEGKVLLSEVSKVTEKTQQHLKGIVKNELDTQLKKMGYSSKQETAALKKRIKELEKKLRK